MPIYEYVCVKCNEATKVFYKTFNQAEEFQDKRPCSNCRGVDTAIRVPSSPIGFGLYGNPEGYSKPSATKRFSNKTVSQRDGNKWSGS